MNQGVYSAANDFTLRMKGLPQVKIVGVKTGGGGGLPMSSELPNGWAVRFSSSRTYDADGADIEQGITPDVVLKDEITRRGRGRSLYRGLGKSPHTLDPADQVEAEETVAPS